MKRIIIKWRHGGWCHLNKVQEAIELGAIVLEETETYMTFEVTEELANSGALPFYFDIVKPTKPVEHANI